MEPLIGIKISGCIWRLDDQPLDTDWFWDKLLDFIESNDLLCGLTTSQVDLNETDGVPIEL